MILYDNRKTKALIRLHECAGWSANLLFANTEDRFSHVEILNTTLVCLGCSMVKDILKNYKFQDCQSGL